MPARRLQPIKPPSWLQKQQIIIRVHEKLGKKKEEEDALPLQQMNFAQTQEKKATETKMAWKRNLYQETIHADTVSMPSIPLFSQPAITVE